MCLCCCSVTKSFLILCSPMNCNTTSFPVLYYLPEFVQIHIPWVSDAILTISFSAILYSSCTQSSQASGSFPVSQVFASGGQRIGASVSASVLPMNIQDWFPLGLTALISLQSKELSRVFSSTTVWKHQFFNTQPSLGSNSHIRIWPLEKPWLWPYGVLSVKWCLCFLSMLSKFVIAFLLRSKLLLILWLLLPSTVILEPNKINFI